MSKNTAKLFLMKSRIAKFESFVAEKVMYTKNEKLEEAKQDILKKFFSLIGYGLNNRKEVMQEYKIDNETTVDYALLDKNSKPRILVVSSQFKYVITEGHLMKLQHGFNQVNSVLLGILTNGQIFQFYQVNSETNLMDIVPFLVVDFIEYVHKERAAVAMIDRMKR